MGSFPVGIPNMPNQATLAGYTGATGPMSKLIGDLNDEVEALCARVGITSSTDTASLDYQIRGVERTYTPVASTPVGTLTMPCTWTGSYIRPTNAKWGYLSIKGVATGSWSIGSGSPFVELTMPSGWTAAASRECADGFGIAYPVPESGLHAIVFPVVHAGATKIRFVSRANSWDNWQFAIDGVASPFAVTVDDVVFDGAFRVRLA